MPNTRQFSYQISLSQKGTSSSIFGAVDRLCESRRGAEEEPRVGVAVGHGKSHMMLVEVEQDNGIVTGDDRCFGLVCVRV